MSEDDPPAERPTQGLPATEDDRRAAAAAANRKRALDNWEANKKRWRKMSPPPASPAAGSTKPAK